MIDVKVRYNTLCDDNHLFWRVIVDGEEKTASHIIFEIPTYTTKDTVFDVSRNKEVEKHHISCLANKVDWVGNVVTIK
jgi:hypothetical protein